MNGLHGESFSFPQEKADTVELKVYGDELYARYETLDGYTVVYDDSLGQYCYALLEIGELISSGVTLDEKPPESIVRHLEESSSVVQERVTVSEETRAIALQNGNDFNETFGPNQGLLEGRKLSVGKVRGLTILVNFADITSQTTKQDVELMLNGKNYKVNGNTCSVRDYFLTVSSNKLDYTNKVVGPFTLKHNRQHYIKHSLVEEAINLAIASGVDFSEFDSLGHNIVDAVNILYAGKELYKGALWPHNTSIDVRQNGVRTHFYTLAAFGASSQGLSIGTFCHEAGHLLCRFPDLYDYGSWDGENNPSSGIGAYCLMGAGSNLNWGLSPAPVCAYLRNLAGWCDNVIDLNVSGRYEAKHGDYSTLMRYKTSKNNEYFLVENRTRIGLDKHIKSSGLAIYHCDIYGSNEYQQGAPNKHYQCALLQADGRKDLETNPKNIGDIGDLFSKVIGPAVNSITNPSTREWDRRDSGLKISDISASGQTITFKVGETQTSRKIKGQSKPNVSISQGGIRDSIDISQSGVIRKIQVGFNIEHLSSKDLLVKLISPSRKESLLDARESSDGKSLATSLNSDQFGELSDFVGQPVQGNWVLSVRDLNGQDTGKLVWWEVNVQL